MQDLRQEYKSSHNYSILSHCFEQSCTEEEETKIHVSGCSFPSLSSRLKHGQAHGRVVPNIISSNLIKINAILQY